MQPYLLAVKFQFLLSQSNFLARAFFGLFLEAKAETRQNLAKAEGEAMKMDEKG